MSVIRDLAMKHGIDKLRFFFPARSFAVLAGLQFVKTDLLPTVVECRADTQQTIYDIVNTDHKLRLMPLDTAFAADTFYIVDFLTLCGEHPDRYYIMTGEYDYVYFDARGRLVEDVPFKPGTVQYVDSWRFSYRQDKYEYVHDIEYPGAADAKQAMRKFVRMQNINALRESA